MIVAEVFMNFLEEGGPLLLGDTVEEGSVDPYFIASLVHQNVAPGVMFSMQQKVMGFSSSSIPLEKDKRRALQSGASIERMVVVVSFGVLAVGW